MGEGFLMPIPCVHLASALETCRMHGRVAFGTKAISVFENCGLPLPHEGKRVLIYASRPEFRNGEFKKLYRPGCATFSATFVAWVRATDRGLHPIPELRPISTIDNDSAVIGFWEVSDLKYLSEPIPLIKLKTVGGRPLKKGFIPEGPTMVTGDDL